MVTETGNRLCSVEKLIEEVLKQSYGNRGVLEKFLRGTKSGTIVQIECVSPAAGVEYEVIGRIKCRFDPDGDVPEAALIQNSNERVPYSHIKKVTILQPLLTFYSG